MEHVWFRILFNLRLHWEALKDPPAHSPPLMYNTYQHSQLLLLPERVLLFLFCVFFNICCIPVKDKKKGRESNGISFVIPKLFNCSLCNVTSFLKSFLIFLFGINQSIDVLSSLPLSQYNCQVSSLLYSAMFYSLFLKTGL